MSRDFQIAWPCPHATIEEVVRLGPDRKSLPVLQPVAANGAVRVLVNDEFFVPQSGLFSPAVLHGTYSGPFDIRETENVLTIETAAGSQTVTFPVVGTARLTADQVLTEMLRQNMTLVALSQVNGHLSLTETSDVGSRSLIRVRGSAAPSLGFGSQCNGFQWGAVGRQIFPSWGLALRPDTITNRYPKFTEIIRVNPIFKVSYSVPGPRCLRCGGTYVENDYRFGPTGQAILIENEDLLYQAALKIILTDKGSNAYHPWYGTDVRRRLGSKALGGVAALISEDVRQALTRLQELQTAQANYQQVTFKERLYSVLSVRTMPHNQERTTFLVDVVVQNASNEPIELSIVFTVPEVVALMGNNLLLDGNRSGAAAGTLQNLFLPNG